MEKSQNELIQKHISNLNKGLLRLCMKAPDIDSTIITEVDQMRILSDFFPDKKVMSYKKLYRATEEGFQTSVFHTKCDNIRNNLVLCHT